MLPNSARLIATAAPTPLVSSLSASAPRAAAAVSAARPFRHQRRWSSSKPSSSDNGPKDIPGQSAAVPSATSSRSGEAKSTTRKRKSKDAAGRTASQKLPSVPMTSHVSQEALGLSTFFSLHRPISVTHSMPKSITEEAFAAIFNMRNKPINTSEVISTLSRTADELDGAMAKMTIGSETEADANGDPVRKVDFHHADGSESSMYLQLNAMAGQFVPFRPPPAPEAQTVEAANAQVEAAAASDLLDETPHHRVYKALFTIEESTDTNGEVRVMAHSPRIVNDAAPRSFLERMARRQMMFDEAQPGDRSTMHALSVRRQRKLKMKKHKYKKLMRRTRNLRRKLDRL